MSDTPRTDFAYTSCMTLGATGIIDPLTQCSALLERKLAAVTQERDALRTDLAEARRQVAVLVKRIANLGECPTDDDCPVSIGVPASQSECKKCWSAWAAQQAKEGGE